MARKHEALELGSGDVFVDLGFADAGERKLRVQLAMQVNELIARRQVTRRRSGMIDEVEARGSAQLTLFRRLVTAGCQEPARSSVRDYPFGRLRRNWR